MSQFETGEVRASLAAANAATELSSFWQEPSSENERRAPVANEVISNLPATRQEVGRVALPESLEALAATQDTFTIQIQWAASIFSTIHVYSAAMSCLLRRQKHRRDLGVIDRKDHPALEIDMSYAARLDEEITRREATRTGMRPVGSPEDTQKRLG